MNSKVDRYIFHVGFPKTGSSFLQKKIFPIIFNGENGIYYINDMPDIIKNNILNNNINSYKETHENIIIESNKNGLNYFISFESLVGDVFNNFYNHNQIKELIKGMSDYDSKIIMVIRKQDNLIESLYVQYIKEGGYKKFDKFSNYNNGEFGSLKNISHFGINIDIKTFNYLDFYNSYKETFGEENVLVLPYELLEENPKKTIELIYTFINGKKDCEKTFQDIDFSQKVNKSYSKASLKIARILNRLVVKENNGIGFIIEQPLSKFLYKRKADNIIYRLLYNISIRISIRWFLQNIIDRIFYKKANPVSLDQRGKILNVHSVSNKELDKILKLNLNKYGYY